jgi:hypothetical protein
MTNAVKLREPGLARLRALTRLLDDLLPIPFTRFRIGLDPLIGLVPVGGDAIGAAISTYALLVAARLGAPVAVLLRMCGNIALDAVVGTVPFLGDLFDFGWKANRRNLALLQRYELTPGVVTRGSRLLLAAILLLLLLILAGAFVLAWFILRYLSHHLW